MRDRKERTQGVNHPDWCIFGSISANQVDSYILSSSKQQYGNDVNSIQSKKQSKTKLQNNSYDASSYNQQLDKQLKNSKAQSSIKYRQRKKQQLKNLEDSVQNLDEQIISTDKQLKAVKDKIMIQLVNQENQEIYCELENMVKEDVEYNQSFIPVDIDKINLLLDTLKTRIGASSKQRQAKLNYHFKSIVNTIFPALYRYMLFTANQNKDLFNANDKPENQHENYWRWSQQIMKKLNLSKQQQHDFLSFKNSLNDLLVRTKRDLYRLDTVRQELKESQIKIEKIQEEIRVMIDPIESAKIILFCEKYKYKSELFFWKNPGRGNQIQRGNQVQRGNQIQNGNRVSRGNQIQRRQLPDQQEGNTLRKRIKKQSCEDEPSSIMDDDQLNFFI